MKTHSPISHFSRQACSSFRSFSNSFLSTASSLPLESSDSYMKTNLRREPHWLACLSLIDLSATEPKSRRLRRPVQRTFAPKRDLNRPNATRLVRPPFDPRAGTSLRQLPSGRSDKWACLRTVEVEHVLETPQQRPPQAATPPSLAKGSPEHEQAKPIAPASEMNHAYTSQPTRAAQKAPTIEIPFLTITVNKC